jgi:Protein of unknown function (DUF3054)
VRSLWFRRLAPVLDAGALVLFVAIGRDQHHLAGTGLTWFATVLWPLAVGWTVGALATRLYADRDRIWLRLLATIAIGVVLQALLRGLFTDRPYVSVFTVVAFTFLGLTTFGWRLAWVTVVGRRRGAPAR